MSLTIEQISSEAMQLSVSSRAELAEKLVGSLDFSGDDDIRRAWAAEAIRRRDEVRSGKVQTIPGDEVVADVRRFLEQCDTTDSMIETPHITQTTAQLAATIHHTVPRDEIHNLTGPETSPNPADWRTELNQPLTG